MRRKQFLLLLAILSAGALFVAKYILGNREGNGAYSRYRPGSSWEDSVAYERQLLTGFRRPIEDEEQEEDGKYDARRAFQTRREILVSFGAHSSHLLLQLFLFCCSSSSFVEAFILLHFLSASLLGVIVLLMVLLFFLSLLFFLLLFSCCCRPVLLIQLFSAATLLFFFAAAGSHISKLLP